MNRFPSLHHVRMVSLLFAVSLTPSGCGGDVAGPQPASPTPHQQPSFNTGYLGVDHRGGSEPGEDGANGTSTDFTPIAIDTTGVS